MPFSVLSLSLTSTIRSLLLNLNTEALQQLIRRNALWNVAFCIINKSSVFLRTLRDLLGYLLYSTGLVAVVSLLGGLRRVGVLVESTLTIAKSNLHL